MIKWWQISTVVFIYNLIRTSSHKILWKSFIHQSITCFYLIITAKCFGDLLTQKLFDLDPSDEEGMFHSNRYNHMSASTGGIETILTHLSQTKWYNIILLPNWHSDAYNNIYRYLPQDIKFYFKLWMTTSANKYKPMVHGKYLYFYIKISQTASGITTETVNILFSLHILYPHL